MPVAIRDREQERIYRARGPFLESPGNFSGPKSKIQIEYKEEERVSWLANCSILFH